MGGTTTAVRQAELRTLRGVGFRTSGMQRWLDRQFARLAVLPTSAMMLLIFGIPLAFSFYLSFQGWCAGTGAVRRQVRRQREL